MADLKISQLTGASTPLAGTEVLPIVQSGSTVKVSVANLTAGRAVAMAGGSFTDNITQSTAAKGVNFTANTPAAGMTSQLLNWYEEGTFTPTVVGSSTAGTTSYSTQSGRYTRVGNQVTVQIVFTVTNMTGTGNLLVGGLPFTVKSGTQGVGAVMTSSMDWASGTSITFYIPGGGTTALFYSSGDNIAWAAVPVKTAWEAIITATYFV